MSWKRGLGIGLIFVGLFVVVTNAVITGAVIGFNPENYLGLLGIFLFIIGIFLTVVGTASSAGGLEEHVERLGSRIAVYETRRGHKKEKDNTYYMTDPNIFLTDKGNISLRDFKDVYDIVKRDPELLERARNVYGKSLLSIAQSRDKNKAEIAREFLKILYEGKIPKEEKPTITKEEREEIKNAFNVGWKTDFNGVQRAILRKYGLWYENTAGGHLTVYPLANQNLKVIISSNPSDYRTGRNAASYVINLIRKVSGEEKKK
ncbi:MAG: hypothetical protein AABW90_02765 [Nanoarchaeota archaeon]